LCTLLRLLGIPILYLRKLWSEQLSSPLISHSLTATIKLLFVMVKSMLLDPLLLWKVNCSLSSFIMWSCLFARYSSSFLLLEFVILSCQVDRELLSVAIKIFSPLANCNIVSIFCKVVFYLVFNIKVHTCSKELVFMYYFYKYCVFIDICVMSMASIFYSG